MPRLPRLHLFEVHDQAWCPRGVRDAITDLLQWTLTTVHHYAPAAPVLARALREARAGVVVDLGAGAGGPWVRLLPDLAALGVAPDVVLTDKYPNWPALERARARLGPRARVHPEPVDATTVPSGLAGFRTMFTTFHHFPPGEARAVLADAVRRADGIAVFEATHRSPVALLGMLGFVFVLAVAPFVRPFRWDRLFWTYVLPLVPVVALWDAVVSCLRTYTPEELRALTAGLDRYAWQAAETRRAGWPIPVTYLVGYPKSPAGGTLTP